MKKQILSACLCLSTFVAPVALTGGALAADGPDREAIERVAPEYPRGAERRGIEGSVRITYSVTPSGEVVNAEVVEATPAGVFDRAALVGNRVLALRSGGHSNRRTFLRTPVPSERLIAEQDRNDVQKEKPRPAGRGFSASGGGMVWCGAQCTDFIVRMHKFSLNTL